MINLYSEDIELLKELYFHGKIEMYFFHEKYKLSPAQLARTLTKFIDIGLIIVNEQNITLNNVGRNWIIANRKELFLKEKTKHWKDIPDEMKQDTLIVNQFYVPDRKKLDQELFKNIEDGK